MKFTAIILFGGVGQRLCKTVPKQFVHIKEKPLMHWCLSAFKKTGLVDQYLIVTHPDYFDQTNQIATSVLDEFSLVQGGDERAHSVFEGLKACKDTSIVAIHDGARPIVEKSLLQRILCELKNSDAQGVIPAIKISDTIKKVSGTSVEQTVDRETLVRAQTPQIFNYEAIFSSYEKGLQSGFIGTDCASYAQNFGFKVHWVAGDERNIKLTYEEDMIRLRALIDEVEL